MWPIHDNCHIEKVLGLGESHFYAAIAALWNVIVSLGRFYCIVTETEIAIEYAF